MASVYVSYKSQDEPFVAQVIDRLKAKHEVHVDWNIPAGADWRAHLHDRLREAEVFLIFASSLTATSDYQNAELGAARFCSAFIDQKLILAVVIDAGALPRTLQDLDGLFATDRDPDRTAEMILQAIERRRPRIRLFVSHSHKDEDLAAGLVDAITSGLEVPTGALRCTSVPGYQLDLGTMAPDALRRELGSAGCVVALLTPNSLAAECVLFELGAAWANARTAIPLLVGGLTAKDIPGPFRGAAGGELANPVTLDHLLDQLSRILGWKQLSGPAAAQKRYALAQQAAQKSFARDPAAEEVNLSFAAKRTRIGTTQGAILDHITQKTGGRGVLAQADLEKEFAKAPKSVFYRLEQLRLLGFLQRTAQGGTSAGPTHTWGLTERYRDELVL